MKSELINIRPDARVKSNGCNGTLEREDWRDVVGYEGLYQVSSFGRVRSLEVPERNTTPYINSDDYPTLGLTKDGKRKLHTIHRLVMTAFVPNPHNLPVINHRNEVKTANYPDNMEWCSIGYNVTYGKAKERASEKLRVKVCQYDASGELVKVWECGQFAADALNISVGGISKCYKGKLPCYGGFIWRKYGEPFDKYTLPTREELLNIKPPTAYDASVDQYDRDGNFIATYPTIYEAERNAPTTRAGILNCCNGKLVTSGKCIWRYEGEPFDKYLTKVEREKRTMSSEQKERLRQINLNTNYTKKVSRPVEGYNNKGEVMMTFSSISRARAELGNGVVKAIYGERPKYKGLRWRFTPSTHSPS